MKKHAFEILKEGLEQIFIKCLHTPEPSADELQAIKEELDNIRLLEINSKGCFNANNPSSK